MLISGLKGLKKNMYDEVWVNTEILLLTIPNISARASSPLSRVCCANLERIFWNAVQNER